MTVAVFHLVRKANGPEPFHEFIRSFRDALPTGDWRLVLIFKGFAEGDAADYLEAVNGLPAQTLFIADSGYDISSYFAAVAQTDYDPLIFFNSFSRILDPRWFEIFTAAFHQPGVGLVGATGSLESVTRNHVIYGREATNAFEKGKKYAIAAGLLALFPPFPNPHVRTNAFMIRREHFLATNKFPVRRRLAALFYESGWLSLTRQIRAMGLQSLVVNRDGIGLPPEAWADAGAFRSGDQEKLLVEDNRSREYAIATDERKQMLRRLAFGHRADS